MMSGLLILYITVSGNLSDGNCEIAKRESFRRLWKQEFNSQIYYPYSYPPSMELINTLQQNADNMPIEQTEVGTEPWKCIGPFGFQIRNSTGFHSGRARDFDFSPVSQVNTIATATGGIFRYRGLFAESIGDNLPFCNINTLACHPSDTNIILVGTGEEGEGLGLGLLKTTNAGANWQNKPMASGFEYPQYIFKIRYSNINTQEIYAATSNGLQKSTNNGESWIMVFPALVTDFVVNPINNNIVYAAVSYINGGFFSGIYISRNGGVSFSESGTPGLPPDWNFGNVKIAISAADTSRIYISVADTNRTTKGVYKSLNSGASWIQSNPAPNFHGNGLTNQGYRNNAIGVSQTNADIVVVAGVKQYRTTDGMVTWTQTITPNGHDDGTKIVTLPDGKMYWLHDGGISGSVNGGATWSTAFINQLPTVEFYNIATPMNEKYIIAGGTQDNGTPVFDNTQNWQNGSGGDGAGITIDPMNTNRMISFTWQYNGYAMHRNKTSDYFSGYSSFNNVIPPNDYWWGMAKNDFTDPAEFYTNSGPYIYHSVNSMTTWNQMNASSFTYSVKSFSVTPFLSGSAYIYAALDVPSPNSSNKVKVYDGTNWSERSSGLPADRNVTQFSTLKSNKNIAVAIMGGLNNQNQKVYKTTNAGLNWENISGNLTDLPLITVLIDQDQPSYVYLGTSGYGMYRTTNNGVNWSAWNFGLPRSARISDLSYIDSAGLDFTVVASTFGRSVYIRNAYESDPVGTNNNETYIKEYSLEQNYPNPFNPETKINFSLPGAENVVIRIYDITGRLAAEPVNARFEAGRHSVRFNGSHLASGVYFYRFSTSRFTAVKKMVLVK
ncbi:MAG: T9SS type A sorting domain-containing protein [Ignavibacteria bacterium]|nr:T9SS type A sorting domain-containing protein [Ignavibacteria bacterium]